jgi:glycosyltransferase involved in cell wall biosynthesis
MANDAEERPGPSDPAAGQRLDVLYVIDSLGSGGAESSLAEMLLPLRRLGVEVAVALLRPSSQGSEAAVREAGYRVDVLPGRRRLAQIRALRRRLQAERPDVVHTTLFRADVVGRLAAWRTGIPVLTSRVNVTYDPIRLSDPNVSRLGFRLTRAVDRWSAVHLTDHFHAITHAVKEAAVRDLGVPAARITVIERGRSAERLGRRTEERRRQARSALGLDATDEVVIHVGRQEYQKGQRHLIEAMERLGGERPRLRLLFLGRTGHATSELRRLAEESPYRDRIRFLGYREDVADLLAAADVFAFPSLYEGLGGSLIEAMALGLPIVASDLAACREVLEEDGNALLVERGSGPALAESIASLLADHERAARFGRRSREIFEERFRLEGAVARMAALYRRVAGAAS